MALSDFLGKIPFRLYRKEDIDKAASERAKMAEEVSDLKLAVSSSQSQASQIEEAIKERRRSLQRPLMYRTPAVGSDMRKDINYTYYSSGYDLAEIGRAIDVEPYINQSVRKHREQILKEGYSLNGEDQEMVDYCKKRLFEISLTSGITTQQVLREFTTNLVAYGTAFLVLKRDAERSSGRTIRMYGRDREPIAGIYPLDPTCVSVSLNDYGHPIKWRQKLANPIGSQTEITFDADDVLVATIDKKPGFIFGTPYILPTLDDVRSLRRLEEIAELIGQRHAFPLLHFKVGLETIGPQVFPDGTSEIEMVRQAVENMSRTGGLITSNRVEGDLLGGDKNTLDIVPYLEYFESRVLGGLRLSEVDLGRGGATNKASAVTVSQGLQDSARDFQAVISDMFTYQLILPLCMEGGYDVDPTTNLVEWSFSMINREEERAHQAHGQDMFLGGTITQDEFRKGFLKKKPLSEEEQAQTNPAMAHERDMQVQQLAGEQAVAKAKATKAASAAKKKSSNTTRPANQHGKKSSKTRVTKNSLDIAKDAFLVLQDTGLGYTKASVATWVDKHQGGVVSEDSTALTKDEELKAIFESWINQATQQSHSILDQVIDFGAKECLNDLGLIGEPSINKKMIDRFYKNSIEKSFKKVSEVAINLINSNDALSGIATETPLSTIVSSIFDQISGELKALSLKQIDLAYRYGYAKTARSHGYTTIVLFPDGWHCEDCEESGEIEVSLIDKNGSYKTLLATHSNCEFDIRLGQK